MPTPLPAPAATQVTALWTAFTEQLSQRLAHQGPEHRSLVLLPFKQLLHPARQAWLAAHPTGLMPNFQTTGTWLASLPPLDVSHHSYQQQAATDSLQARQLLAQLPSLQARVDGLYGPLLATCQELAPLAICQHPDARSAWQQQAQASLQALNPAQDWYAPERAMQSQIGLVWLGQSQFASDALFAPSAGAQFEQLIVVDGLHPDPLSHALLQHWQAAGKDGGQLALSHALSHDSVPPQHARLLQADSSRELLDASAYAVLQHLASGRRPVALVAQDRHISRQLRATLEAQGATIKDETGWKLSTTQAASRLLALLDAARPQADMQAVLAWLHACLPPDAPDLHTLEQQLRLRSLHWPPAKGCKHSPSIQALLDSAQQLQEALGRRSQTLSEWCAALSQALTLHQLDQQLTRDEAGLQILRLLEQAPQHPLPLSLSGFISWLRDALEEAHFLSPSASDDPDVVLLPMAQMLGRHFAAVVLPAADHKRLPLLAQQHSAFSRKQAQALGLPLPEDKAQAQKQAFLHTINTPFVDVLWAQQDSDTELNPSPLLEQWRMAYPADLPVQIAHDALNLGALYHPASDTPATQAATAHAGELRLSQLSASSYQSLRSCPYQFYASRLLRLRPDEALDSDPAANDWGTLLHATLLRFHRHYLEQPKADPSVLLQTAADEEREHLEATLSPGAKAMLLPKLSDWPSIQADYLQWLEREAQTGTWQFIDGEHRPEQPPSLPLAGCEQALPLTGSIDRIDQNAAGELRLLDYKSGDGQRERKNIQLGEDVQLPFYALLLQHHTARVTAAAYLGLKAQKKGKPLAVLPTADLDTASARLEAGITQDFNRIYAEQAPLYALGSEQGACRYCELRGLCRKDHWPEHSHEPQPSV